MRDHRARDGPSRQRPCTGFSRGAPGSTGPVYSLGGTTRRCRSQVFISAPHVTSTSDAGSQSLAKFHDERGTAGAAEAPTNSSAIDTSAADLGEVSVNAALAQSISTSSAPDPLDISRPVVLADTRS